MAGERKRSIDEIFQEGTLLDRSLEEAVRLALLRHKKLGESVVIWRDGRVVWLSPEEIPVEDGPPNLPFPWPRP